MKDIDQVLSILLQEKGSTLRSVSDDQKVVLYRTLVNTRRPKPLPDEYFEAESNFLKRIAEQKGVVDVETLRYDNDLTLWQGDITRLNADAIVNAANSELLGCFIPCHNCIDNVIHTYAGVNLRLDCDRIIRKQGHPEPNGSAKITLAYNLPAEYVIHTIGPCVSSNLTERDIQELTSCYRSCLQVADGHLVKSIAFPCISTGVFNFPAEIAAEIAVSTCKAYKTETGSKIKIIFNVFKQSDLDIYKKILNAR